MTLKADIPELCYIESGRKAQCKDIGQIQQESELRDSIQEILSRYDMVLMLCLKRNQIFIHAQNEKVSSSENIF